MKAWVNRIFTDYRHGVEYTWFSPAKYHDDIDTCNRCFLKTPMMEIRVYKGKGAWENVCTYATPEVVKAVSRFDFFYNDRFEYSFENRLPFGDYPEIDFDWVEGIYPYFNVLGVTTRMESFGREDYISPDIVKYPKIHKITNRTFSHFLRFEENIKV